MLARVALPLSSDGVISGMPLKSIGVFAEMRSRRIVLLKSSLFSLSGSPVRALRRERKAGRRPRLIYLRP